MRIIVSWLAWYHDFLIDPDTRTIQGISPEGPNVVLHRSGFLRDYDRHLLLTSPPGNARIERLEQYLLREGGGHALQVHEVQLHSIFDLQEIKAVAEDALRPYQQDKIDLLFSTGTTPMRSAWLLIHLEANGFDTRLVQSLDTEMGQGQPGLQRLSIRGSYINQRLEAFADAERRGPGDPCVPPTLRSIYDEAAEVARTPRLPILIQGPSGAGKEQLARHLHRESARRGRSFVPVNCAAFGAELLESRLFGYAKGAFTGAKETRKGFFDAADGGILFLDEIGDISPYMQQTLLRVLQEGRFQRVGGTEEIAVDVRLIAASNRDLYARCEAGQFRWDLYYRLAGIELHLPAWAELPQADRAQFIDHFLALCATQVEQRSPLQLDDAVRGWLLSYQMPGNLRELQHLITRLYVYAQGRARWADLQRAIRHRPGPDRLTLEQAEADHIRRVFDAHGGNVSQTAAALGIERSTLRKKLEKYGLR